MTPLIAERYKTIGGLVMEKEDGLEMVENPLRAIKDIIKGVLVSDQLRVKINTTGTDIERVHPEDTDDGGE